MADARRIVIVGGGITGLAAAHAAIAHGREIGRPVQVTVLEAGARLGGNVTTERQDGFVLDPGPDSWVVNKPQASALCRELGLGAQLVGTNPDNRRFYIVWGDRLHPVPEGLVLGVPTRIGPLVRTSLFSWPGKARMGLELLVPQKDFDGDVDESIGEFAARRLGREASERLVAPLLGGISGGNADEISVRASFPMLVAMEREHGSLVRGMQAMRAARAKAAAASPGGAAKEGSAFVSLSGGVGDLVTALASRLATEGATLRTGAAAEHLERAGDGWVVRLAGGQAVAADGVVLAVPAHVAAALTAGMDDGLAARLGVLTYGSTVTVFLGYRRADVSHPLDGVGFVVPRAAGRSILAGTWVSSKWDGRAPEGHVLLRAFFSGTSGPGLEGDDAALVALARGEMKALMGLSAEPVLARVFRFPHATAHMRVGHLAAMRGLREELARVAPGVLLAGNGYDGVGIPDCVRMGTEAARALVDGAL